MNLCLLLQSEVSDDFINAICGFTPNPFFVNTLLLFHSYRKVQEGNPELGMMVGARPFAKEYED